MKYIRLYLSYKQLNTQKSAANREKTQVLKIQRYEAKTHFNYGHIKYIIWLR